MASVHHPVLSAFTVGLQGVTILGPNVSVLQRCFRALVVPSAILVLYCFMCFQQIASLCENMTLNHRTTWAYFGTRNWEVAVDP